MPKRTKDLSEKLSGEQQPAGWQDQLNTSRPPTEVAKEAAHSGSYRRKTYLINDAIDDRVRLLAEREHVGQNELVRYLLSWALDQIESGVHKLPTAPVEKRTLGV